MTATAAAAVIAGIGGAGGLGRMSGIGSALPPRAVTGTGHLATVTRGGDLATATSTGDLATAAGLAALDSAGTRVADLLILATSTPDPHCPATAPHVASRLGLTGIGAYDLAAACSGFIHALAAATEAIAAGGVSSVLVIGADARPTVADTLHSLDRGVAARFGGGEGTGAGAVLLRRGRADEPGAVLGTDLGGAGIRANPSAMEAGASRHAHTVRQMTASARAALYRAGWLPDELDAFVAHHADQHIVDAVADRLGVREGHRVSNSVGARETHQVSRPSQVGETAAASVPLSLSAAVGQGVVPVGGPALLTAFGAGPAWGSVAIRWPDARPVYTEPDGGPVYADIIYMRAASAEPAPKESAYAHADYFCAEWGAL